MPRPGRLVSESPRRGGGWRLAGRALLGLFLATIGVIEGSVLSAPSVAAVPSAVSAIDTEHAGTPVMVSPSSRVAVAIIAAEDDSFYSNDGLDLAALVRGVWGFVTGADAGGSTIEIQLAHLAFPYQTTGFWGRVHRVTLALQMDTHFTKPAILSMYLDAAYFGHGFYGVEAASLGYFGVAPPRLAWDQAALLAGLVQAPSRLDPFVHPQAAAQRRGYVLQRLAAVGALSEGQAEQFAGAHLQLAWHL